MPSMEKRKKHNFFYQIGRRWDSVLPLNRAIFLVCISLAFIFWFFVKLSKDYSTEVKFDVSYELPENVAFVRSPVDEFNVKIFGRGWDLLSMSLFGSEKSIIFPIIDEDVTGINRTALLETVTSWLNNSSIEIEKLDYDYIPLNLGKLKQKKVPVVAEVKLGFEKGFQQLGALELIPDSVIISGAASEVAAIASWNLLPLDLTNVSGDIVQKVLLEKPKNKEIKLSQDAVTLKIKTESLTENAVYASIQVRNQTDSVSFFPKQIQIRFSVGASLFNIIDNEDFEAYIDLSGVRIDRQNNTVPVNLGPIPEGVRLIDYSPKSVEFLLIEE